MQKPSKDKSGDKIYMANEDGIADMLPQIYCIIVKIIELDLMSEDIQDLCYGLQNKYK